MIPIKGALADNAGNSFAISPPSKGSENHDGNGKTHFPAKANPAETAAAGGLAHPTKNSLPEKVRMQIAGLLQGRLADSIDLTLQAKQAHWNVKGPNFIALHELFDKVTEEAGGFADLIAERIVQLGGIAMGTLGALDEKSSLPAYPLNISTGKEHVAALSHSLATYGESIRISLDQAAEFRDPATADLLTGISRSADKYLWFVEAHAQANG
jgi:starvation-inducible DNA-binding protein